MNLTQIESAVNGATGRKNVETVVAEAFAAGVTLTASQFIMRNSIMRDSNGDTIGTLLALQAQFSDDATSVVASFYGTTILDVAREIGVTEIGGEPTEEWEEAVEAEIMVKFADKITKNRRGKAVLKVENVALPVVATPAPRTPAPTNRK